MQGSLIMRPWALAREEGRTSTAVLLFIMQISLVLWPAAVRAACRQQQQRQKQVLLNELAAVHAPIRTGAHLEAGRVRMKQAS